MIALMYSNVDRNMVPQTVCTVVNVLLLLLLICGGGPGTVVQAQGTMLVAVEIILPAYPPTLGQNYSLTCTVSGADPLNHTFNYQWTRRSTTVGTNSPILTFDPLVLSDNGQYRCEVSFASSLLGSPLTVTSPSVDLTIQISTPTVTLTPPSDTVFVGDTFTLTCMAQLDSSVDVAVSVTVLWTGPGSFSTSETTANLVAQDTLHSSTLTVSVAMAIHSGEYGCSVALDSVSNFIITSSSVTEMETITVVPAPLVQTLTAISQTSSIMFSWSQQDSDVVDSYAINLVYLGPCSVTIEAISGSLGGGARQFEGTELIGFGDYQFTLTAINRAGSSAVVSTASTLPSAPSGHVQNLVVSSYNSFSVSLEWDRENCLQRNGEITGYMVTFGLTTENVFGTESRVYAATGLIPRSEYTFQVSLFSANGTGPSESISQTTIISPDIMLYLGGQLFSNNSLVDPLELGEDDQALLCLTNYQSCCDNINGLFGEWYYPNMETVPVKGFGASLYRNRGPSLVRLNRRSSVDPTNSGIYRCEILSGASVSEHVYVGLYPPGQGSPTINTDIVFYRDDLSLNCTSSGGPASEVMWTRNGVLVGQSYTQTQVVSNLLEATYSNILRASSISYLVGEFNCTVTNTRGSDSRTIAMDGITIEGVDNLPFTVGSSASIRCVTESPATMIQWLDPNRMVVTTTTMEQSLDMELNLVNDSLHNSVYTCSVIRTAGVSEKSVLLTVSVPDNIISVETTIPVAPVAGTMYTVTCVVLATITGLMDTPTATWEFDNGMEIISGGGIMVTRLTSNVAELRFTDIKTSQAGGYVCRGIQTSPALSSPQIVTDTANIVVMVPTPMVSFIAPPSPLYAGTSLSLICTVSVVPAVDTTITLTVTWERTREDGPVAIGTGTSTVSTITVSTLDIGYSCRVTASTTQSISPEENDSIVVIVTDPPPPVVNTELSGSPIAGTQFTLLCRATAPVLLVSPPTVSSVIGVHSSVTMTPISTVSGSESTQSVLFSPLLTSHGGVYTCQAGYDIPQADLPDLSTSTSATVVVQIPRPTAISIITQPDMVMVTIGLNVDLVCRVELISDVDSPLELSSVWIRDGTPVVSNDVINIMGFQMVGNNPQVFQSVIEFRPLIVEINDTDYTCNITIVAQDTTYISGTSTTVSTSFTVKALPFPMVTISPSSLTIPSGQSTSLTCTVTVVEYVVANLTVEWRDSDGLEVVMDTAITIGSQTTSTIMFPALQTSQAGQYTCIASIDVLSVNIVNHTNSNTTIITAQIPTPLVSVMTTQPAYHGTTHNLTCTIVLDSSVDTPITLDVVWSYEGNQLQSSGPFNILPTRQSVMEYTSTLNISPLNQPDMSSGDYICEVRVQPDIDTYIREASGSGRVTLEVLAAPAPVMTTDVPGRPLVCGEAFVFTCSASVLDNFVTRPVITWMGPDNQVVGDKGNLNVQNGGSRISAGTYRCMACVTVSSVSIVDLCTNTSITIAYSEPGPVESLSCSVYLSSADMLNVSWTPPTESESVVGYQVEVRQYISSGERQVSVVELSVPFNREIPSLNISVPGLEPAVRYQVAVMAVSAGGCGSVNRVECYTMEGVPSQVQGVTVDRLSDSQMNVSWSPLTIVETKGFLRSYIVTHFRVGWARHKKQIETVTEVAVDKSSIVFDSLEAEVDYDVTVSAQTTSGMISPASSMVRAGLFVLFQLRLINIKDCPEWVTVEQDIRISRVSDTLVTEVQSRCNCGFTRANIMEESFQCFLGSENAVTYRAKLGHTNSSSIIDIISQWKAEDGIARVQLDLIRVDKSCEVSISSFADKECISQPESTGGESVVVGGVTGSIVVVLFIIIFVIVIAILVFKSRQAKVTLDHTDENKNQSQSVSLHEVTITNQIEPYEMMEEGHEYKDVSRCQQGTGAENETISHTSLSTQL